MSYCDRDLQTLSLPPQNATHLRAWLSPADKPRSADLIFVLAGKMDRKEYALELFRQSLAPRLLFSVGRFEIRRLSKMPLPVSLDLLKLAEEVSPPQRHYFVFFQGQRVQVDRVPPRRFGTLTEIEALAHWLSERPDIRSVLVVSSDTHLRRIRMCCRALLSPALELSFLSTPSFGAEQPQQLRNAKGPAFAVPKEELLELFKLAIYWVLLKVC